MFLRQALALWSSLVSASGTHRVCRASSYLHCFLNCGDIQRHMIHRDIYTETHMIHETHTHKHMIHIDTYTETHVIHRDTCDTQRETHVIHRDTYGSRPPS